MNETKNYTNKGALFKNVNKTQKTSPDYKGKLNVNGVEYVLNGWVKTSDKGGQFLSLSILPATQQYEITTRKDFI